MTTTNNMPSEGTMNLCASLLGCKRDTGMENIFWRMDREGRLKDCRNVGEYLDAYLDYMQAYFASL